MVLCTGNVCALDNMVVHSVPTHFQETVHQHIQVGAQSVAEQLRMIAGED